MAGARQRVETGLEPHWVRRPARRAAKYIVTRTTLIHQAMRNHNTRRPKMRRYSMRIDARAVVIKKAYVS